MPNSISTIDHTVQDMNGVDAALTLGIGAGVYTLRPLARAALDMLEAYERRWDPIDYDPEWYRTERQRLNELPDSIIQSALQQKWQILHAHLSRYRQ